MLDLEILRDEYAVCRLPAGSPLPSALMGLVGNGYVISVTGAATLVGEKTLVRIEKVGRSAAQASLVNPPPDQPQDEEKRPRRRGRRGGRRRRKSAEPAG